MLRNSIVMAWKVLRRRAFFTFASLFGISFTLFVLILASAFLDHVFAPSAPESRLDRMLFVDQMILRGENNTRTSSPGYRFLDREVRTLPGVEQVTVQSDNAVVATFREGSKISLSRRFADGKLWRVFDFHFLEGGPYTEDDEANANPVAVINERIRDLLFDGESAVGRQLNLEGQSFRVIGVVENLSLFRFATADVWTPISTSRDTTFRERLQGGFEAAILVRSKADIPLIQEELESRAAGIDMSDDDRFDEMIARANSQLERVSLELFPNDDAEPKPGWLRGVLVAGALLFMLLPSLNLVNLSLSRTLERSSEIGVRRAFGAHRGSLLLQFLLENVVLTLLGALLALLAATLALKAFNGAGLGAAEVLRINPRVFFWGLGLALAFGLISGLYPAWRMSRLSPVDALRLKGSSR